MSEGSHLAKPDLDRRQENVGRRLWRAFEQFEAHIIQGLRKQGFTDFRPSHGACLRNVEIAGTPITELARRAQMTKQAMSLLVRDLEKLGYVKRTPHATDGRVKLVVFTTKGRELLAAGLPVLDELDRAWKKLLTEDGFRELNLLLDKLVEDPSACPVPED